MQEANRLKRLPLYLFTIIDNPVQMRIAPTGLAAASNALTVISSGGTKTSSSIGFGNLSINSFLIDIATTAATAGISAIVITNGSNYIELDAEL